MTISVVLRDTLRLQVPRVLGEHAAWALKYLASAPWHVLRRDFPRQWERIKDAGTERRSLARELDGDAEMEDWLRQDLILLAVRESEPLPVTVLGNREGDSVRAAVAAGMAQKQGRPGVEKTVVQLRSWSTSHPVATAESGAVRLACHAGAGEVRVVGHARHRAGRRTPRGTSRVGT